MPAVSANIGLGQEYDSAVATFMIDEFPNGATSGTPYLLVQSLTISGAREERRYKGANRATQYLEFSDPILDMAFDAYVLSLDDLATSHPGTVYSTPPSNYRENFHGFSSADGQIVYLDPVTTGSVEEMRKVAFTTRQFPFVAD